jgi:6-carboxyhexanoate--CoA ligase
MRASNGKRHISGAEGIYREEKINDVISYYMNRAFDHVKGQPDSLSIKVSKLNGDPEYISLLNMITLSNGSIRGAKNLIWELLCSLGISHQSIREAVNIIYGDNNMRGAAIIGINCPDRMEHDKERGTRTTEIGIVEEVQTELSTELSKIDLDNDTVREAVTLASKVAGHDDIVAELCISDDHDYTTGYIASSEIGYIRVPNIKEIGSDSGGRVFFIKPDADINDIIDYLEKTPVMIDSISEIKGEVSQSEFFSSIVG